MRARLKPKLIQASMAKNRNKQAWPRIEKGLASLIVDFKAIYCYPSADRDISYIK